MINNHIERKCQNSECDFIIAKRANPKRIFCSLRCKNRFHYHVNALDNLVFKKFTEELKYNRNFLSHLIDNGNRCFETTIMEILDLIQMYIWIQNTLKKKMVFLLIFIL